MKGVIFININEVENLEKICIEYENLIGKLENEKRELQIKVKDYENIVFALKSILDIAK